MSKTFKSLTREEQVREIIKCGKDPIYFIKNYAKIQHPTRGMIPFATYEFQDDCVNAFVEHRLNIVLKARQLGLSTIVAAYATWFAIFQKDKNILVIATKLSTAMGFIKKVAVILDGLPEWLLLPQYEPSKQQINFSNGSVVKAVPTSDDAGRSEALSLLIVDEAAIIRDFDEIWTGLAPTISTGGRAIVLSTPKGVGGQYYRLWTEAEAGVNEFNPIRLHWSVHPEHDKEWFAKETKGMSKRDIAQEYLCDFLASGDTFLQTEDLDYLRTGILPPIERVGIGNNVWIWSHPIEGRQYVISVDVARGDAHDYSAFHVIDTEECEVVVEYMGKIPPEDLADLLALWGKKYNDALIMVEQNTFGYFANTKLRDNGYPHLYYHGINADPFTYIPVDPKALPGFPTSQKTRFQILAKLSELIRAKSLKTYSQRLFDQLQAFVWQGNKPMASKDSYDDLVMALAIGCWLVEGNSGLSKQAVAMSYAILNATKIHRRDISQMPGNIDEARPLVNPHIRGVNPHNVHRPRDASQVRGHDVSDFSWLLK